jgi:alkylation response protein AidB-like acyl-CoA dehydrogenase
VISATDAEKGRPRALSPESRAKRRKTWERHRMLEREAVRRLRLAGLVPLAIADELGLTDRAVGRRLRQLQRDGEIPPLGRWRTRG